jgi:hypothetical protein
MFIDGKKNKKRPLDNSYEDDDEDIDELLRNALGLSGSKRKHDDSPFNQTQKRMGGNNSEINGG